MDKIYINCKYRDEIIVPLVCVSPNMELFCIPDKDKVGILCLMKDGILAKIRGFEMKTVFEFEEDIKRLYKVEPYEWLKKMVQCLRRNAFKFVSLPHISNTT